MKHFYLFFTLLILGFSANAQCPDDNTFSLDATPPGCPGTSTITGVNGGSSYTVDVVAGNDYTFSTCGNTAFDTQITVYDGATVIGYNDDDCGVQSTVTWTATFTGTIDVLVDEFNCSNTGTGAELVVSCALPVQNGDGCNTNTTICTPGQAGPFTFSTPGDPVGSCLNWIGLSYAYIVLYITESGPLELLIDGDATTGFLDVAIFDVPNGVDPCVAQLDNMNEISCNYADASGGCNEIGTFFGCNSSVPSPNVTAGDVLFIVVENWSNQSTDFTLDLGPAPAAQTGPPDPSITAVGPFCATDGTVQLNAVDNGGTWTGTGVSPTGLFDPAAAGPGTYTIDYTIGSAPCDAQSSTSITVNDCSVACFMNFFSYNIGACNPVDNTFEITGEVQFTDPPTTGTLTVTDCNGNQQTFFPPFVSPQAYALTGIDSDGSTNCDVTAVFSADPLCTFNLGPFDYPIECACAAEAGTYSDATTGSTATTGPWDLCFGDNLDVTALGDYTPPNDLSATFTTITYDPGVWLLVYDCPPTVMAPTSITDAVVGDPCLLGVASTADQAWTIANTIGDGSTAWYVPVTMYSMVDGIYAVSINGGDWCYDMGPAYQVTYLEQITFSEVDDCALGTATITINGGLPAHDGSLFTASNLSPASASFDNTTASDGGDIVISGLAVGDAYSFDVVDANNCPITITGTMAADPFPPTGSNPAPINVQCSVDVPTPDVLVVTTEADNLGVPVVTWEDDNSNGGSCPEIITRRYRITDACDNFIFVTQTITIDDTVDPVATGPADAAYQCIADVPAQLISEVTGVSDNCTAAPVVAMNAETQAGTCPIIITREFTVTDDCGNVTLLTQTITVDDTIDPVATGPADAAYQCLADVPAQALGDVTGISDNCTVAPVVAMNAEVQAGTCPMTITREYTVTDDCGNQIVLTQTITVDDTIDPTATNPIDQNGTPPAFDATQVTDEADNCGVPTVTFGGDVSDGGNCPEIITREYIVTDACGNTISVFQTFTVGDAVIPTASNPLPIVEQCIADVAAPDPTVVTDEADNGAAPIVTWESDVSDGNTCPEVITRTYRVTDDCGNFIFVTQTITVDDTIDPVATAPADAAYQCISDVPAQAIGDVTGVSDNCTAAPVVAMNAEVQAGTCPIIITREYTVTDDCGNQILLTQTITVDDTVDPVATAPADAAYQCLADVPAQAIGDVTGVSDNCTAAPVVAMNAEVQAGTCPMIITREYTVTDDCGNQILLTQTITVDDTVDPVATGPIDAAYQCLADVPAQALGDVTGVSDNCTAAPVVAMNAEVQAGTCPMIITREYTVTDDCGNQIVLTQTITVDDTIDPTATDPVTTIVPGGPAPAVDITVVIDEADNCGVPTVAFVSESTDLNPCPETITRIYSVTDACGNTINVTHLILITDPFLPTASNPLPINVECIGDVPAPDPLVVTDEADNQGAPVVAFVSDVSDGLSCPETITRTYSVTDLCLGQILVTQTITVNDVTAPTATAPATVNVECIGDVPAADALLILDEADNCTAAPVVAFVGDVSDGLSCPETITRTYSITDDCGNVTTVDQLIIVDDVTAPTATAPTAVLVECIGDVPASDILLITDEADNCTVAPVVAFVGDVSDGLTCPETITRTYSITDDCGNVTTVDQIITVNDITDPTASNPVTTTVPGGPVPAVDITVVIDEADNCGVPTVAFVSESTDGAACPETITRIYSVTDACGNTINVTHLILITDPFLPTASNPLPITEQCFADVPAPDATVVTDEADNQGVPVVAWVSDVSDGNTCPETITRTYSVTDICGGQILVTQTITVDDTIDPVATAPADAAYQCISDVPAQGIGDVIGVSDNCTAAPVVAMNAEVQAGTCPIIITREYTVTDNCGNQIVLTQTITVNDTQNPTASDLPQINVECIADVPVGNILDVTDEADNCTVNPIVVFVGDVSDGNTCPETITRTYSVSDDCGNQILVTQTIIVNDITPPTASNLNSISVAGPLDVPAPDPTMVADEADNCTLNPTVAFVSDVSDGNVCNLEEITRTYSVTDDCGNQILVTQLIIIEAVPAPISVEDHLICLGDEVTLIADNPWNVSISWSGGVIDGQSFSPTSSDVYTVTADNLGCISSAISTVTVEELPVVNFVASEPGCEPYTVVFTNQSSAGSAMVNCIWNIDGASPVNQCGDLVYTFPSAGVYGAGLTITSENGCVSSVYYDNLINIVPMPIASFEASSTSLTTLDGDVDFTNTSEFSDSYSWNFGDGSAIVFEENPSHTFPTEEEGGYNVQLIAYNSIGCTDTAFISIRVDEELIFYVPNTFTPDNDAYNNTFQPVFTSGYDPFDFNMFIFNRWGEVIFESHDARFGWDGTYGGKMMQDGSYTWKIDFKQSKDDKRIMKTGHVNILR